MRTQSTIVPIALVVLLTAMGVVSGVASAESFFSGLGNAGGIALSSRAWAISSDGSTVVGEFETALGTEAFRWTRQTGLIGLGNLSEGTFGSVAYGVSADGSVIVGAGSRRLGDANELREAFRWTSSHGMVGLGNLAGANFESVAFGVSADGSVVVGTSGISNQYGSPSYSAFRWTSADGMIDISPSLPHQELNQSVAYGVSADGAVIAGRFTASGHWDDFRAGAWTEHNGWRRYPGPTWDDERGQATAVSADGSILVGSVNSPPIGMTHEAFLWMIDGQSYWLEGIDPDDEMPEIRNTVATAISADGAIIVGTTYSSNLSLDPTIMPDISLYTKAFIWDSSRGFRLLQDVLIEEGSLLSGWTLLEARGLSADGRTIIGTGINPFGQIEAWIASIETSPSGTIAHFAVPEPSSIVVAGMGLLAALSSAHRRYQRVKCRQLS